MTLSEVHKVKTIFKLTGDLPFSFLFSHEWTGRIPGGSLRADHMQRRYENATFHEARRETGVKTESNASLLSFFVVLFWKAFFRKMAYFH